MGTGEEDSRFSPSPSGAASPGTRRRLGDEELGGGGGWRRGGEEGGGGEVGEGEASRPRLVLTLALGSVRPQASTAFRCWAFRGREFRPPQTGLRAHGHGTHAGGSASRPGRNYLADHSPARGSGTEPNFSFPAQTTAAPTSPSPLDQIPSPRRHRRPHRNRSTVPAPTRARWPPRARPLPTSPARPSCRRSAPPRRPTIPPSSPLLRPRSVRNPLDSW